MSKILLAMMLLAVPFQQDKIKSDTSTGSGDILLSSAFQSTSQIVLLSDKDGNLLMFIIADKDGNEMVKVTSNGDVSYGKGYTPDQAARTFWEVLAKYHPVVCGQHKDETPKKRLADHDGE